MRYRCAAVLCALLFSAGCGQKGPLYLPGDPNEGRIVIPSPDELSIPGEDDAEEQADDPGDDEQ